MSDADDKKPRRMPFEVDLPEIYGGASAGGEESAEITLVQKHEGRAPPGFSGAPIELNVVRSRGTAHVDSPDGWIAVEVWTRNRVYMTHLGGRCVRVFDRRIRRDAPDHPLLGAVLSGGQRRGRKETELAQPFPLPGMKAVFKVPSNRGRKDRFVETSNVERVVLRLGVMSLDTVASSDAFHELTARFFVRG